MPNIAKILRDEIQRLARREAKAAAAPLKKDNADLKRAVADLKRRTVQLERAGKRFVSQAEKVEKTAPPAAEDDVSKARITAKMVKSIRARLGVSQADFAKLVGVSRLTVYQWEAKKGRLQFRGNGKAGIVAVRHVTKAEAKKRLA